MKMKRPEIPGLPDKEVLDEVGSIGKPVFREPCVCSRHRTPLAVYAPKSNRGSASYYCADCFIEIDEYNNSLVPEDKMTFPHIGRRGRYGK